jgi:RNA polymerase sigma factor (sigma-70 family)
MSAVAGHSVSHTGALSDDDLVQLARDGDEPAFDEIVRRYRAPLVNYCRRWLDPHRAEEVVQHTLMKAFVCVRDDDRPLVLRPWLYRVAHNAALNAVEKKGSDWEELDENYDGVPQPPQVAEQRARFLQVVDGIGALPRRQRDALVLNEFEGRCYADIAAELGTSESGVRGLLRRARRQLRETAAALFLPIPMLRELVRSDPGRLQVDRAGELIGSAGAVGGAGLAGGLTKVAAGVLAAGTIAGGGTAIEQGRDSWRAPAAAETAQAATPEQAETAVGEPAREFAAGGGGDSSVPVPVITLSGAGLLGGGPEPGARKNGPIQGIDEPVPYGYQMAAADPAPAEPAEPAEPEPLIPALPKDELAADGAEDEDGTETSEPTKESTSQEPAAAEDEPEGETESTTTPQSPAATPATPLKPQRQ